MKSKISRYVDFSRLVSFKSFILENFSLIFLGAIPFPSSKIIISKKIKKRKIEKNIVIQAGVDRMKTN